MPARKFGATQLYGVEALANVVTRITDEVGLTAGCYADAQHHEGERMLSADREYRMLLEAKSALESAINRLEAYELHRKAVG